MAICFRRLKEAAPKQGVAAGSDETVLIKPDANAAPVAFVFKTATKPPGRG